MFKKDGTRKLGATRGGPYFEETRHKKTRGGPRGSIPLRNAAQEKSGRPAKVHTVRNAAQENSRRPAGFNTFKKHGTRTLQEEARHTNITLKKVHPKGRW